ncbi:hypothetical protein PIB30_066015 [Stylosanthes scabra]|uniref:Uncharacterized protein n=1 Tax=Stylosanthes scabra TaxID=79078 RepID=A0ABU6XLX3_9FABA|nr:hypothetical protein [Stylosanthes scabra]
MAQRESSVSIELGVQSTFDVLENLYREPRSRGAGRANDSAYGNSGLSGVIVYDRGRMIGHRGSTNDGYPVLVPDRSGLAMITDRVWRFIRIENPWVGDSHSVYYQAFQVQVQAWKVGEVILKNSKCLISPEAESPAVYYGELGMSRIV